MTALLEVRDLTVEYGSDQGPVVAVDRVSLDVAQGEFVGIVGESGCGKSTLLFAIARLLSSPAEIVGGSVMFQGTDMVTIGEAALRRIRWRDYSVVMQSAMNALNPVLTIGEQLKDAILAHERMPQAAIRTRSREVMRLVGIDPMHLDSHPHQLSGGMRQRSMIAMALVFTPQLVIMDEPTSALDVVGQRSLMVQIKQLQDHFGFAVIFVTHDMSLVSRFSDRLAVMYAGQLMELGGTAAMFTEPKHPYTVGLMRSFPSIRGDRLLLQGIPGSPPVLSHPPAGCRFHPRCPRVMPECSVIEPRFYKHAGAQVRCHLYSGAPLAAAETR